MNAQPIVHGRGGALVLSLDFELHWGVRDHRPLDAGWRARLLEARRGVEAMLDLFQAFEVSATWATVGVLFARDRGEALAAARAHGAEGGVRALGGVGAGEGEDPFHFAPSLIERIRATPGQEVATHTFSHLVLEGDAGSEAEAGALAAELGAAQALAGAQGVTLHSIVFPRNRQVRGYDRVLQAAGISAYRGNPPSPLWAMDTPARHAAPRRHLSRHLSRRLGRFADSYLALDGAHSVGWDEVLQPSGLSNVRASRMLRPYTPALRALEPLRRRRIEGELREAARRGRIYHLWWHPHNFGAHLGPNLHFLRGVLEVFAELRATEGMRSLTMAEVDRLARTREAA
jgi:peptidoglycan/xylan/chitin deacetylase (PgdA/CDA1 family)